MANPHHWISGTIAHRVIAAVRIRVRFGTARMARDIRCSPLLLNLVDLTAPGVTGSQVGMSDVQLAVNLRGPGVNPATDTAQQDAKVQARRASATLEKFADREVWLRSWLDYFRTTEHPRGRSRRLLKRSGKILWGA
jgi:hypothetical protein